MKIGIRFLFLAVILAALVYVMFDSAVTRAPGYVFRTIAFQKHMSELTDADDLQTWAISEIEKSHGARVQLTEIPQILVTPKYGSPNQLSVHGDANHPYVVATWGGGFGHWGLFLSDGEYDLPDDGNYHIEWKPGVVVWHEIQ